MSVNKPGGIEMAKKLWEKSVEVDKAVETYTVGRDREMDLYLAPWDVVGSLAHITMLESVGLLKKAELDVLTEALRKIYSQTIKPGFVIEEGVEDIHSQVELMLTHELGDTGKKIHSGRSRNDQVLLDLKLFMRSKIEEVVFAVKHLFDTLISQSNRYRDSIIPGYTHLQVAMPSSVGLWLGAYAESLVDDMVTLAAAYEIVNRNPLGSAAGYGSSFPLDREMTSRLLGFEGPSVNVVYAQMGRGKTEKIVAQAIANVAATVGKLAFDACMFNSQNFGFISLPAEYTTGSSIMPHKKNPDVFELTRAKCNRLQALPNEITLITNNLPSGYFRDLQLVKENFLGVFDEQISILQMTASMIGRIKVNDISVDKRYDLMYSVEEVNRLVLAGVPFRDAYKQVGLKIERGEFTPDRSLNHTHLGSIGNLGNELIERRMNEVVSRLDTKSWHQAVDKLVGK